MVRIKLLLPIITYNNNTITGTKGVARAMTKICQGPAYKEGTTWFQELSDKRVYKPILGI